MRKALTRLLFGNPRKIAATETGLPKGAFTDADVIITPNEVNDRHGTGVILRRIFGDSPNVLSIRSSSHYGEHSFGAASLCLSHKDLTRAESFQHVLDALNKSTVRRVLCVPYFPDDLITAIAIKELHDVPLCTYVMDDSNVFASRIPDALLREALEKSSLRLAISPEMRDEYEKKFGLRFWLLPPVVTADSVQDTIQSAPAANGVAANVGLLVGSIWSAKWFEWFRRSVKEAGLKIHWYGNTEARWLKFSPEELAADGIKVCGFLPEAELTAHLKDYAYAVIPSGSLDADEDRQEVARLSLPTRIPYLLAVGHMPMVVIGSPETAAAQFVTRMEVGVVTEYDGNKFRQAVEQICKPEAQQKCRQNAARHAGLFSAAGMADWVWQALSAGEPKDDRFGRAMPRDPGEIVAFIEPPTPKDIWRDFNPVYQTMRRLKEAGLKPDFVVDVGASTGIWSDTVNHIFSDARYILVDPLINRYAKLHRSANDRHPNFERVEAAVSDQPGQARFQVSGDLYGSSLLHPADYRTYETIEVPVITLDQLLRDKAIKGRGILKIDVQCAEHLVLAGAAALLPQVDVLLMELSLVKFAPQAKLFVEMCNMIAALGFRFFDETGGWRCPQKGTLLQKDAVFVRGDLLQYVTAQV